MIESIESVAARILLVLTMLVASTIGSTSAAELTLAWDPNQEPDLAGYRCYYGTSGNTPMVIDVAMDTQVTLTDLQPGLTYSFYVTAYNAAGLESEPSQTIYYTVPLPNELRISTLQTTPQGNIALIASGDVGTIYALQTTDDLLNGEWVTIGTSIASETGFVSLQTPPTADPKRFYRLFKVH